MANSPVDYLCLARVEPLTRRAETADHGDIARLLADAIVLQLKARVKLPVVEPLERIRATVIGASQFTVQVSGKTIYLPDASVLPVHNVPVVHLGQELDDGIVLRKLDFVDVGDWLDPPGGVPVVIKSLLFPAATDRVFGQVATTA